MSLDTYTFCEMSDAGVRTRNCPGAHSAAGQAVSRVHLRHVSFCCVAQEKHAVFSAPVVKRAFCIASATFSSPAQLEANAGTAAILADLRLDADTVAAALLQGALDASPLTGEQLAKLVPPGVAAMVAATSRINSTCIALQADHSAKVGALSSLQYRS